MAVKLSVCLTTYNRAKLLDRSLETLAAQTRVPDELIVSDNCSLDETASVAEKWRPAFSRYTYHRNEKNLGMPGNLNVAIGLATGSYIANLHDGDLYDPSLLEKWERALDEYPTAGFVFCGLSGWPVKTKHGGGILRFEIEPFTKGREFFERRFLGHTGSVVWGTVMARRTAYEKLLPFDASFGFVSDVDMWMRMCLEHDVAYVDEALIHLDHTPSAFRKLGTYNWSLIGTFRQIQLVNIDRHFGGEPERLAAERRRFGWIMQRFYAARLLGRIRRGDVDGFWQGVEASRELPPPLGWVARRLK
jgi:glycosyltransferase involved in cell wall biosynthesis